MRQGRDWSQVFGEISDQAQAFRARLTAVYETGAEHRGEQQDIIRPTPASDDDLSL